MTKVAGLLRRGNKYLYLITILNQAYSERLKHISRIEAETQSIMILEFKLLDPSASRESGYGIQFGRALESVWFQRNSILRDAALGASW